MSPDESLEDGLARARAELWIAGRSLLLGEIARRRYVGRASLREEIEDLGGEVPVSLLGAIGMAQATPLDFRAGRALERVDVAPERLSPEVLAIAEEDEFLAEAMLHGIDLFDPRPALAALTWASVIVARWEAVEDKRRVIEAFRVMLSPEQLRELGDPASESIARRTEAIALAL